VITGAASGIGLAAADRLAAIGMRVCMADVNAEALERSRAQVARHGSSDTDVLAIPVDVSRRDEWSGSRRAHSRRSATSPPDEQCRHGRRAATCSAIPSAGAPSST
jgi:NAD(P)-dependent dehydrogenase (short-subunit alcohol dehydrogenase family)